MLTLDSYRAIGRNAAAHALGKRPSPVPTEIDNFARAKLIVQTTPAPGSGDRGGGTGRLCHGDRDEGARRRHGDYMIGRV